MITNLRMELFEALILCEGRSVAATRTLETLLQRSTPAHTVSPVMDQTLVTSVLQLPPTHTGGSVTPHSSKMEIFFYILSLTIQWQKIIFEIGSS